MFVLYSSYAKVHCGMTYFWRKSPPELSVIFEADVFPFYWMLPGWRKSWNNVDIFSLWFFLLFWVCLLKSIGFGWGIITNNASVAMGGYVLLAAGLFLQLMPHFLEKWLGPRKSSLLFLQWKPSMFGKAQNDLKFLVEKHFLFGRELGNVFPHIIGFL